MTVNVQFIRELAVEITDIVREKRAGLLFQSTHNRKPFGRYCLEAHFKVKKPENTVFNWNERDVTSLSIES